jgi:hypothetical protein
MTNRLYMAITKAIIVVSLLVLAVINTAKRWQSRKEHHEVQPTPQDCQQQQEIASIIEEEFQREENFKVWYAQRMDASRIILPEKQVRRLYETYLSNEKIIKSRVVSEVAD